MGIKRIVDSSFWTDGKIDEFSPEDKYFMVYLLTSPYSTQLGIYEISIKYVAMHLGYSMDAVKVLLDRFENKYGIIFYSPKTHEIAVKNYLRHSIIKGGAPVRDCLIKEMKKVKNKSLIERVFAHLKRKEGLNATVRNIITEYEAKNGALHYSNENANENDNENENDNDNEVSYHDTSDDTSEPPPEPAQPEKKHTERKEEAVKHRYGEHQNVLLTDDELGKLQAAYPDWKDRIERLSSYMASRGKRYKSHYATIQNWARTDEEKKKQQELQMQAKQGKGGNVFLGLLDEMEDFG